MPDRIVDPGSTLASLFPSRAMARLVVFFAVRPGHRFHLRELQRRTGLASASLQRELQRLVDMGALVRESEKDGRSYFMMNEAHDSWRAWTLLLRSAADPADVLREVLVNAEGIEGGFVFGSAVRGDARPDSDVDLLLVVREDGLTRNSRRQLSEAELLIGRPLDIVEYGVATARQRMHSGDSFLHRILAEPKTWVYGGPEVFAPEEAA